MSVPILIADDHELNRKLLVSLLSTKGHEMEEAKDGTEALAKLREMSERGPVVGLIDWQMPGLEGIDVCRHARDVAQNPNADQLYLILLTVRDAKSDIVAGLEAAANDYTTKPFNGEELLARVAIGAKMVLLQQSLAARVAELEVALGQVKQLSGLLPICMYCKKIRDDKDYWQQVDHYIAAHTSAVFSHGICPECFDGRLQSALDEIDGGREK